MRISSIKNNYLKSYFDNKGLTCKNLIFNNFDRVKNLSAHSNALHNDIFVKNMQNISFGQNNRGVSVYAIQQNGEYKTFASYKEASNKLVLPYKDIKNCAEKGKPKIVGKYTFAREDEILYIKNGIITENKDVIESLRKNFLGNGFYIYKRNGEPPSKFSKPEEANKELGISIEAINNRLKSRAVGPIENKYIKRC